ncbi:DUF262 domain-containing protein [Komagataeibacter sp. FNDCF1]|uniref:DUF262 domain-containing protein n=1 Tax=Komagataeibacter sp. FNDCF1 TaxID=2878681 RepID=UPI001E3F1734|nr:DUF262 domain-containing protein [Komagataeibacter sp. FNDCF1]MCE2563710.1 DUF262 domain-containing HNH endonuclease family protein [Komagataeibacter sp. FNDCF1]
MTSVQTKVKTEIQTANILNLAQARLEIPCYQRPYVWPGEEVKKFLEDIHASMARGPDGHYFIGTLITANHVPEDGTPPCYELIDGQQRMTTLFLIALACTALEPDNVLAEFVHLAGSDGDIRLNFAIREQVRDFLHSWPHDRTGHALSVEDPYLRHMRDALATATDYLLKLKDTGRDKLEKFGWYLFNNVRWVNNIVPPGTDLNQLFTALNTSGIQLEASDILKARLLEMIPAAQRMDYDAIWQACENMNGFFENNLKQVFPGAAWQQYTYQDLKVYDATRFHLDESSPEATPALSLRQILATTGQQHGSAPSTRRQEDEDPDHIRLVKSIITFPQLLLHALRIHNWKKAEGIEAKDIAHVSPDHLNGSFRPFLDNLQNDDRNGDARGFIECLWSVRHQFDQWVMKRIPEADNNLYCLPVAKESARAQANLYRSMPGKSGTPLGHTILAQLQSVRYFTTEHSTQYWLTPFLGRLVTGDYETADQVTRMLEKIDNLLSCATHQKETSFDLLSDDNTSEIEMAETVITGLMQAQYPGISHYWFQKLEYILWKDAATGQCPACLDEKKILSYRITSKNSVEHVFPQNPTSSTRIADGVVHGFGNLALINAGANSAYSNRSVIEKREQFLEKEKYDSIKLAYLFSLVKEKMSLYLEVEDIDSHKRKMEFFIRRHYGTGG